MLPLVLALAVVLCLVIVPAALLQSWVDTENQRLSRMQVITTTSALSATSSINDNVELVREDLQVYSRRLEQWDPILSMMDNVTEVAPTTITAAQSFRWTYGNPPPVKVQGMGGPDQWLHFTMLPSGIDVKDSGNFQNRGTSIIALVYGAYELIVSELPSYAIHFAIYTQDRDWHDTPSREVHPFPELILDPGMRTFMISDRGYRSHLTMPSPYFHSWPELERQTLDEEAKKISERSAAGYIYNKVFWAGGAANYDQDAPFNPTRGTFCKFADENPSIAECKRSGFISIYDHADYSMLIDLEGGGVFNGKFFGAWSARVIYLAFFNRTLILQDRDYWDWAGGKLIRGVHYLGVKQNMSDLQEVIQYARTHHDEMAMMTRARLLFVSENFTLQKSILHICSLLRSMYQ